MEPIFQIGYLLYEKDNSNREDCKFNRVFFPPLLLISQPETKGLKYVQRLKQVWNGLVANKTEMLSGRQQKWYQIRQLIEK